ncbi:AAA family ATPase [Pseudomonas sp. SDO528_S397]
MTKLIKNIEDSVETGSPPFITYLIGNNGTGKSRLLANICDHYEKSTTTKVKSVLCVTNAVSDRFTFTHGRKRRYLGARAVGNAIFLSSLDREIAKYLIQGIKPGKMAFLRTLTDSLKLKFSIQFPASIKNKITSTMLSETIDNRKLKNTQINKLFTAIERKWLAKTISDDVFIDKLTIPEAAILKTYIDLNPEVVVYAWTGQNPLKYSDLSSGEQNRIATALKIIANAENNCLVLIDEPEISLHLKWQMEFHAFMTQIMENYKNYHVLIATHSPVIVSEAAKDNETDAIIVLNAQSNRSVTSDQQLEFIGYRAATSENINSCDGLTLDLFDTATYNTKAIDQAIAEAILDASEPAHNVEREIKRLTELLNKNGMPDEKRHTINEAISLIRRHFQGAPQ